jgi:hypothetical protein
MISRATVVSISISVKPARRSVGRRNPSIGDGRLAMTAAGALAGPGRRAPDR